VAESQGQGDFWAGLVVGTVVGSVVGTVIGLSLAPRLQNAAQKAKSRGVLDHASEDDNPEETDKLLEVRRSLETKINELNAAIQDTRSQLLTSTAPTNQTGHHD
jgi:gas vesicle protein